MDKIIEIVMAVLSLFGNKRKKVVATEVREFSDLVKGQYEFLMQQLDKVLKDYFSLSTKVKEMHTEIFSLTERLAEAMAMQCLNVPVCASASRPLREKEAAQ